MGYIKTFHCFHGTTKEYFAFIKKNKEFQFQLRKDHWLGNGVYFFLDDKLKAEWWSRMAVKKYNNENVGKKSNPCVVYLEAKTDIDKVIDLNVEAGQKLLDDFAEYLKKQNIQIDIPNADDLDDNEKELISRCILMDLLVKSEGYVASCYQFPHEDKPYRFKGLQQYGIINNRGNQLCVYNQKIIDFSTMQTII